MPVTPIATENTITANPESTMLHLALRSLPALYMVNRRDGSATGFSIKTRIKLTTFHPPMDAVPRNEKYSAGVAARSPPTPPDSCSAEWMRKPKPKNRMIVCNTSV